MTGPRHLDRDGARLAYRVHGTPSARPPLLLTHGYGATSAMWAPNLAALAAERQVITWDVRGHGDTTTVADPDHYSAEASVADMVALLDRCDVGAAVVGGLSLGGYLSLAFHLAHPDRVRALLLFDTGPGFRSDESRAGWNAFAVERAQDLERRGLVALGDSPELAAGPHDPVGLALAARGILVQHDPSVIDSLPGIRVPTLVLVGERDRPFLAAADHMAAKIPDSTKVVLRGAGHASNLDRPAEFDAAVTGFLAGIEAPPR